MLRGRGLGSSRSAMEAWLLSWIALEKVVVSGILSWVRWCRPSRQRAQFGAGVSSELEEPLDATKSNLGTWVLQSLLDTYRKRQLTSSPYLFGRQYREKKIPSMGRFL